MSSSLTAMGIDGQHHGYGWIERHISILVIVGGLLAAGLAVFVMMVRYQTVPPFEKQIGLWAILLLLVSIGIWGQRNSNRRLRSVDVSCDGLWFGGANQRHSELVPWVSIERVERFSHPDRDAVYIRGKSGLRIFAGGRTLYIYEHIRDFAKLLETIEGNLPAHRIRESSSDSDISER